MAEWIEQGLRRHAYVALTRGARRFNYGITVHPVAHKARRPQPPGTRPGSSEIRPLNGPPHRQCRRHSSPSAPGEALDYRNEEGDGPVSG